MLEIRVPRERSVRKLVMIFIYLFIVSFISALINAVVAVYTPAYSHISSMLLGLMSLLIVIYLAFIFLSSISSIYLRENNICISHGVIKNSVIDLDYTRKIVFSRGLKRMSVMDASGKRRKFNMSDLGAENVQRLINALSEVAEKYGFLLVDENSNMSWGAVKGHALSPEEPAMPVSSEGKDDEPYRVK